MKLIIAGGRNYKPNATDEGRITDVVKAFDVTEIVSGGAGGADEMGETYAKAVGLRITVFPAKWGTYGKKAGPMRNEEMAAYADVLLHFPGGSGTRDMIRRAQEHGLKVYAAYVDTHA